MTTMAMAFWRSGEFGITKDVEFENGVQHDIGVEAIVPRVGAHQGRERTTNVVLLIEQVEAFEAHGECIAFQE